MHTAPKTMNQYVEYKNNNVVSEIIDALNDRIRKAIKYGVRRWNIILDPGIGKVFLCYKKSVKR